MGGREGEVHRQSRGHLNRRQRHEWTHLIRVLRDEFEKVVSAMGFRLIAWFCKRVVQKIHRDKQELDTTPPVSSEPHVPQTPPSSTVAVAPTDASKKIQKLLSDTTSSASLLTTKNHISSFSAITIFLCQQLQKVAVPLWVHCQTPLHLFKS